MSGQCFAKRKPGWARPVAGSQSPALCRDAATLKELARRQATRKRTLFPLSPQAVFERRADMAQALKRAGLNFYAIRQVLKCSGPEESRRLVARAQRDVGSK